MGIRNPHRVTAEVGDLVTVVTAHGKYAQKTGMRIWLECQVAEVVGVGENGRVKALRSALNDYTFRRKNLSGLVALITFPAKDICVPLAMAAAKKRGKPFSSLEEVRAAVRPFVLADLATRGYDPEIGERSARVVKDADEKADPGCSCGCADDGAIRDCFCGQDCQCLPDCQICDRSNAENISTDSGVTVDNMRSIFGEPVEGHDYHVMPARDAEGEAGQ